MNASQEANPTAPEQDLAPHFDKRRALAPTDDEISRLPLRNNADVARELLAGAGPRALDIGCGDGKFTQQLARMCGRVTGIDVKERKLEAGRISAAAAGVAIEFRNASADAMPFAEHSFDVVVFSNSLHHMTDIDRALHEAMRVLVPGGLLYIMEPVAAGGYFEATRLVNDETAVRTEAYRAIGRTVAAGLSPLREVSYRSERRIATFDEWREDQIDRDEKRRAAFLAQPDRVRAQFEAHARRENGFFVFDQVRRVNLLRKSG